MIQVADGFTVMYGGSRKGAEMPIEKGDIVIDCTVIGWLDKNLQKSDRKNAEYALVRRWSYGGRDNLPREFAVEIPADRLGKSGLRSGRS